MAKWTIAVIILLVVATFIFIVLTFLTERENKKKQQANIIYPFSAQLSPPTPSPPSQNPGVNPNPSQGLTVLGMSGGDKATVPQIKCPAGYKINIVGAFLDITDPFGECSNKANSTLQMTCGDGKDSSSAASCTQDRDCGEGMTCVNGKCSPKSCSASSDCVIEGRMCPQTGGSCSSKDHCPEGTLCVNGKCQLDPQAGPCMTCLNGKCASMPLCQNVQNSGTGSGLNSVCSPILGDKYRCRPRDASAYLAKHCDGKSECLAGGDVWLPNKQGGQFGPLPCKMPVSNSFGSSSKPNEYAELPVITGWGGEKPNNGSTQAPATFSQGYQVSGIYTCIPDDENAVTSS